MTHITAAQAIEALDALHSDSNDFWEGNKREDEASTLTTFIQQYEQMAAANIRLKDSEQYTAGDCDEKQTQIDSLRSDLEAVRTALDYAVGLLPGLAGAETQPDNAVYTIMAAKCEIMKARELRAAAATKGE